MDEARQVVMGERQERRIHGHAAEEAEAQKSEKKIAIKTA
jgi:hypothetical protein